MPHFALGLGIGVIDAALVPLLATFVDATLSQEDHSESSSSMSSYGTVYAIQQTSVSLAYCLGKSSMNLLKIYLNIIVFQLPLLAVSWRRPLVLLG